MKRDSSQLRPGPGSLLVAALLLTALAGAGANADEALGRLFFTPEQRAQLDHQRESNALSRAEDNAASLTINGVVTRSSGRRTVWVNGVPQTETGESALPAAPQGRDPGRVVLKPGDPAEFTAKVGDSINRDTGDATHLLGSGRIEIRGRTGAAERRP